MKSSGNIIDKYIEVFCNSLGINIKEFLKVKRNLSENCLKDSHQSRIRVSALEKEKDNRIILFSSYLILIIIDSLDILYFYI